MKHVNYELSQSFFFDAAHTLDRRIETESSRRIHGHTYTARVALRGEPDRATGMVVDLGRLRQEIARVRELLDHRFLDEIDGLGPATLENLCAFVFREMSRSFPQVSRVTVQRQASGDRCSLSV